MIVISTSGNKSQWRFNHVLRKVRPEENGKGGNKEEGSSKEEEVSFAFGTDGGLIREYARVIAAEISSLIDRFFLTEFLP